MLREKCSFRKDIETLKKRGKKQKENWAKVCNLKKQVKAKFTTINFDTWWIQLLFLKLLSYLVRRPKFKSTSSSSLSRKEVCGGNLTPTSCQFLWG